MRFPKLLFSFAILLGLYLSVNSAQAQSQKGIPSDGRDFYIVELTSSHNCPNLIPFQGYWALVSSYYDCNVTVSYFDATGKEILGASHPIPAKGGWQCPLDQSYLNPRDVNGNPLNPNGETPMYSSCHIHSDRPISVSYYSTGPCTGGLYMALQTGALGKTYVVAAMPANPGLGAANGHHASNSNCIIDSSSSEFAVVAIKDNTEVTITPNGLTRAGNVGVNCGQGANGHPYPFVTYLNRGQVYWVKSTIDDPQNDMSGSIVEASEPVAVIAGCENAFETETQYADRGGDQRNLSVEQMVPVDFWTDKDYVSMPMMQSPGGSPDDQSAGNEYKIFTYDTTGTKLTISIDNISPYLNVPLGRFECPPLTQSNVEDGINIGSNDGKKIMVEEYQYRAMNSAEPYPAPEQMNIIPLTRCRTSYMWQVPDDKSQVHKKRYINVIALRTQLSKIFIWHNSVGPTNLAGLPSPTGTITIPGHPELVGKTYEISPGSYYAIGDSAFALYQYGDLGLDPDYDLGDNDDDDYYFSYASTCGISFGIDGAYSPSISANTLCDGWNLHVVDDNPLDRGLSTVDLLKDPNGVLKRKPGTDSGYMSVNVDFDPVDFTVTPGDTVVNVQIIVDNPLQDAWAYVWAVNGAGNDTLIYLHYTAPKLSLYSTQKPMHDSAFFLNSQLGVDTCTQFVFKNYGKAGDLTIHVTGYHFKIGGQGFRVSGTSQTLPFTLAPGDSIIFDVCFNASQAAKVYYDTLAIETDCPTPTAPLLGSTQVGEINASDYDFGNVLLGHTSCHTVRVWNTGAAPFTLTKQWVLNNISTNFVFEDTALLPVTILPGQNNGVNLNFCYTPTQDTVEDSTQMLWASDLPEPFTQIKKDFSILKGHGIKPDLNWDTTEQNIYTQCDTTRTVRCTLHNHGSAPISVDTVEVIGPDAKEFLIIGNQNNFVPLNPMITPFQVYPQGEAQFDTTQWVDVQFTPDLSKPLPARWADRIDTLIAIDNQGIHPIVVLNANVTHAEVDLSEVSVNLGATQPGAPTNTHTIVVTNGGNAPLIIQSITIDSPFSIVRPGSLKQWDTIYPNKSDSVIVQGLMAANGTGSGALHILGMTNCAQGDVALTMSATSISATALGYDFAPTYICTNAIDSVSATAGASSLPVQVVSAQIVDDPSNPGGSNDFLFPNGTHSLSNIGTTLTGGMTQKYGVIYTPSAKQATTAWVIFTFDTASNIGVAPWEDTVKITGSGLQEHTILSVQNSQPGPYIAATSSSFQVPVQMTLPIADGADVHSITMDITFRRDVFDALATPIVATPGYTVVNWKLDQSNDPAVLHVTLARAGNAPFDSAAVLANLQLRVMVAKDTTSSFVISNVTFQNSAGDNICYVLHDTIPESFIPSEYCSNGMLRRFLETGEISFGIREVHPNPATNTVHIGLDVHEDGVPMTIDLYNSLGQLVRSYGNGAPMPAGMQGMDLDLTNVPSGAYSLRILTPDYTAARTLVVQK